MKRTHIFNIYQKKEHSLNSINYIVLYDDKLNKELITFRNNGYEAKAEKYRSWTKETSSYFTTETFKSVYLYNDIKKANKVNLKRKDNYIIKIKDIQRIEC